MGGATHTHAPPDRAGRSCGRNSGRSSAAECPLLSIVVPREVIGLIGSDVPERLQI
jgi:hypothetical protein